MPRRSFPAEVRDGITDISTEEARNADSMALLGKRLQAYRKRAELTQQQLAEALGVTGNAVSMWEKGKAKPGIEYVLPLCGLLGITPSQLFGVLSGVTRQELQLVEQYRQLYPVNRQILRETLRMLADAQEQLTAYRPLRRLKQSPVELSAGSGEYAAEIQEAEPLWVHDTPLTRKADYVFRVNGDSMEPLYHDRDRVLVAAADFTSLQPGTVAAFRADGDLYIKEYRKDMLRSLNPDYRSYPLSDFGEVCLLGRVIGVLPEQELATAEELDAWTAVNGPV